MTSDERLPSNMFQARVAAPAYCPRIPPANLACGASIRPHAPRAKRRSATLARAAIPAVRTARLFGSA
eukprot:5476983-Pleurochrysis_carterae.AAC.1